MTSINSENKVPYVAGFNADAIDTSQEDAILAQARVIAAKRLNRGVTLTSPAESNAYLSDCFMGLEHEVFAMILLDNRNRVISYVELFRGTIDGCGVYPREVAKKVLAFNAAAVILAHNHPSGEAEPSQADIRITERLVSALKLIDVRVLDHIIVGSHDAITSLATRGLV